MEATILDTRALMGHMLEIYRPTDALRAFYRRVADASRDWDGRTLTVEVG